MSRYEPNIGGAVDILIDIMVANGFTLTRQPYDHNYVGLVEALIDLKDGFLLCTGTCWFRRNYFRGRG